MGKCRLRKVRLGSQVRVCQGHLDMYAVDIFKSLGWQVGVSLDLGKVWSVRGILDTGGLRKGHVKTGYCYIKLKEFRQTYVKLGQGSRLVNVHI